MIYLIYLIGIVVSYLLGAIPFGYLFVKIIKREDIRKLGSGNIGATNVARVLGKGPACLVLLLDIFKGFASAYIIPGFFLPWLFLSRSDILNQHMALLGIVCGFLAIIGHIFPVYLGFKGGKGVATGLGVALVVMPRATGLAIVVWFIFMLLVRYISLASIIAGLSLPVGVVLLEFRTHSLYTGFFEGTAILIFSIVLADLIIIRHIPNIKRLLKGTEPKFGVKSQAHTVKH